MTSPIAKTGAATASTSTLQPTNAAQGTGLATLISPDLCQLVWVENLSLLSLKSLTHFTQTHSRAFYCAIAATFACL